MASNEELMDEQINQDDSVQDNPESEKQADPFADLGEQELKDKLLKAYDRLNTVNHESKKRKEKLRALESEQEERERKQLEETKQYQKLYEDLKEKTSDYDELKAFFEAHKESEKERLSELEKKLTNTERAELELLDGLPESKKLKWIELKLNGRKTIDLDMSTSSNRAGSLRSLPSNRKELAALSSQEILEFKQKHPQKYREAMKNY